MAFVIDDLIALAIIGAVGSIGGAAIGGAFNSAAVDKANNTNVELANTAHQREVKDLEAAGLNPWLSANGSGAGGSVQANTAVGDSISSAGSSLASIMQSLVTLKALDSRNNAKIASYDRRTDKIGKGTAETLSKGVVSNAKGKIKAPVLVYSKKRGYRYVKGTSKKDLDEWDSMLKALGA